MMELVAVPEEERETFFSSVCVHLREAMWEQTESEPGIRPTPETQSTDNLTLYSSSLHTVRKQVSAV
jgi:hypothetical protein